MLLVPAGVASADGVPRVPRVPLVPSLPQEPRRRLRAETEYVPHVDAEGDVCFAPLPGRTAARVVATLIGLAHGSASGEWVSAEDARRIQDEYLEASRARRATVRARATFERTQVALFGLSEELMAIWTDPTRSFRERRRRLFDVWDEWVEDDSGPAARATVVGFVRRHLPRESAYGFSDEELVHLNFLRTSQAAFEPYSP
jgi:hypothetical protein